VPLALSGGSNTVEAIVVATAEWLGRHILGGDPDDLVALAAYCDRMRVIRF